jgi:hypothetical protein
LATACSISPWRLPTGIKARGRIPIRRWARLRSGHTRALGLSLHGQDGVVGTSGARRSPVALVRGYVPRGLDGDTLVTETFAYPPAADLRHAANEKTSQTAQWVEDAPEADGTATSFSYGQFGQTCK